MTTLLMRVAIFLALAKTALPLFAQTAAICPGDLAKLATCYAGADQNGAQYWIAIPKNWNRALVLHAHGGPRLSPVTRNSGLEDLERFSVTVRQGFAWAGSSYRRPGYGVRMAAADIENLRQIFIAAFGKPQYTVLHGQSWGGNVAAKGIELYAVDDVGHRSYDGVVLTSGMIAGGTLNYLHRADMRVVYQYYCNNHPRQDEQQYPLWMGLPANSPMTDKELEDRVNECTGVNLPVEQRSVAQKHKLANILGVVPVPERTLVSQLAWATFMFRDLVQRVLGGRNPFSNRHVVYSGSSDDVALNRSVVRFDADPQAVAQLADDSDVHGPLPVPVMTMHAINDPTALVEYETQYRAVVTRRGGKDHLVQTFTTEREHSKLADAEYAGLFKAMLRWITSGTKPSVHQVADACREEAAQFGGGCHFDTRFSPLPLFSRVAARNPDSVDSATNQ